MKPAQRSWGDVAAVALGLALLVGGLVGAGVGLVSGVRQISTWGWEQATCVVIDVHVTERTPIAEKVYTSGSHDVRFDLALAGTDTVFHDMPAAPSRPTYYDQYDIQQEVLRATPGARLDCWVDPDGSAAYIRREPKWFVLFSVGGVLFALVFVFGGLMMLDTAWRGGAQA
jgi:hypothetical protein